MRLSQYMDKRHLRELMPQNKHDQERAMHIVSLGYDCVKPVVGEIIRWLRVPESSVAEVFIEFLIVNAADAAADVARTLKGPSHSHLRYVIASRVIPAWPRDAVEQVKHSLVMMVTNSSEPETALMAIQLLAKHDLYDKEWLRACLNYFIDRTERNLSEARKIAESYF
jgi:hypothetical protein